MVNGEDSLHPVLHLERARCAAIVARDMAALAALLSPQLVYVHAPGVVHGRGELLRFLTENVRFTTVERQGVRLHHTIDAAWTTGLMRLAGVRLPGKEQILATSFVTQVWRRGAEGWQLEVFQSTRVEDGSWISEI